MTIQQLPPRQCFDLREADPSIVHLDVRTPEEFLQGHPRGALNVPVMLADPARGMTPNPEFLAVVEKLVPKDRRVVLSCASGKRSMRAAELMEQAGWPQLVNLSCGFGGERDASGRVVQPGWQAAGLPCETDPAGAWPAQRRVLEG